MESPFIVILSWGKGAVPFYTYLDSLLDIGFSGISKALRISAIFGLRQFLNGLRVEGYFLASVPIAGAISHS